MIPASGAARSRFGHRKNGRTPFFQSKTPNNGSSPTAANGDQSGAAASRTPLTARKRTCPRSCSIKKVYSPAEMKCCGDCTMVVMFDRARSLTCNPPRSRLCDPNLIPGKPSQSIRGMIQSHPSSSPIRKASMPLKKMKISTAIAMLHPRRSRVNMRRTRATPSHVQMGTA